MSPRGAMSIAPPDRFGSHPPGRRVVTGGRSRHRHHLRSHPVAALLPLAQRLDAVAVSVLNPLEFSSAGTTSERRSPESARIDHTCTPGLGIGHRTRAPLLGDRRRNSSSSPPSRSCENATQLPRDEDLAMGRSGLEPDGPGHFRPSTAARRAKDRDDHHDHRAGPPRSTGDGQEYVAVGA